MDEKQNHPSLKITVDEYIKAEHAKHVKTVGYFRMSLTGRCPKLVIGTRAGIEPPAPADTRGNFKMWMGTVLHEQAQKILNEAGFLEKGTDEEELTWGEWKGHTDGSTLALPVGPAIVEIKTGDDRAVKKVDWPNEHYLWQGYHYVMAKKQTDPAFERLLLFHLGTSQGLSREAVFKLGPEWEKKIVEYREEIAAAWAEFEKTKQLPPCSHRFGWEDRYCSFKEVDPEIEEFMDAVDASAEADRERFEQFGHRGTSLG